jgi:hypothetical protein
LETVKLPECIAGSKPILWRVSLCHTSL